MLPIAMWRRDKVSADQNARAEILYLIIIVSTCSQGCLDYIEPTSLNLFEDFARIDSPGPAINLDKVIEARVDFGLYRVMGGDVITITMPAILGIETTEQLSIPNDMTSIEYRVNQRGTITLPIIGDIQVVGKTLAEIETNISNVYQDTVAQERPTVFARISEYKTSRVSIVGAVNQPGAYNLRHDQMSLVNLIMEAGGISDSGASAIRIVPSQINTIISNPIRYGNQGRISAREFSDKRKSGQVLEAPSKQTYPDDYISSRVYMRFSPQNGCSHSGFFTVKIDDKQVASELIDLQNTQEREEFVSRITNQYPELTEAAMELNLASLNNIMSDTTRSSQRRLTANNLVMKPVLPLESADNTNQLGYRNRGLNAGLLASSYSSEKGKVNINGGQEIVMPIKGLNIPFKDVALKEGDRVTVEPLVIPKFTVLGLVNREGIYEYPPGESYNLMEAIGVAGGLDKVTDPRYAVIYRLRSDGMIAHTAYNITKPAHFDNELPSPLHVHIMPGDIVDVAHTPRTRANAVIDRILRVSIGVYVPLWDRD